MSAGLLFGMYRWDVRHTSYQSKVNLRCPEWSTTNNKTSGGLSLSEINSELRLHCESLVRLSQRTKIRPPPTPCSLAMLSTGIDLRAQSRESGSKQRKTACGSCCACSDAGALTCLGFPGSRGNEVVDAQQFADWGVDYLKAGLPQPYSHHSSSF